MFREHAMCRNFVPPKGKWKRAVPVWIWGVSRLHNASRKSQNGQETEVWTRGETEVGIGVGTQLKTESGEGGGSKKLRPY